MQVVCPLCKIELIRQEMWEETETGEYRIRRKHATVSSVADVNRDKIATHRLHHNKYVEIAHCRCIDSVLTCYFL